MLRRNSNYYIDPITANPVLTVNANLGTTDNVLANIKVYPNPVEDVLTISADEELSYTLYSLTGAVIQSGSIGGGQSQVNTGNLAQGFYMLKLTNRAGEQKTVKLLKK